MKLRALDQLHVSSVQADSLRPGQNFEVSDAEGDELMKAHAGKFEKIGDSEPAPKAEAAPLSAKSEQAPQNKAEPAPTNKAKPAAPANKANTRRKRK